MIQINTLNSVIDDIMLIIRNSNIAQSENINRLQIKQWIQHYSVQLIKQDIDKDGDINPEYINHVGFDIELDTITHSDRGSVYTGKSLDKLPRMIDLNNRYSIISVTDMQGNVIQLGDQLRSVRQKYRRFTCNDYIAYEKDGYLYVKGPNLIDRVEIGAVFEDLSELDPNGCGSDDAPLRLSQDKIGALKSMILQQELNIMLRVPSDTRNNGANDLLNIGGDDRK